MDLLRSLLFVLGFSFVCLFLVLLPFMQSQSPQIFLRIIKICSAPHLLSTEWVHTVLQGSQPGAAVPGTGAQWAIFSCYLLNREPHMLRRQASFGSVSNSGQPRDIHLSQLLGQPAAQCSSQDRRQANSVTCPANTLASRLYLSALCLGYSERGLLTLHGNTGTKGQLEGLKCLAKVARKVGSLGFCFHNKVSSGLLDNACFAAVVIIVNHL